jgi:hypothetical protein
MIDQALKNFMELIEKTLDATEPAALDDSCSVAFLAPTDKGLVGLDMDTGSPVRVGWKYKSIHEKPVIIHAGNEQTVIPPRLALSWEPLLPAAVPPPVTVPAEPEPVTKPRPPRVRHRIVDT